MNDLCQIQIPLLIKKPISDVFMAFIEPRITENFWFTKSTGKLEKDKTLTWYWENYGVSVEVVVEELIENELIKFKWNSLIPIVEIKFNPVNGKGTYVVINNYGCKVSPKEIIGTIISQTIGFTSLLDGLKAYLEHGIKLNSIEDKFVYGMNT